MHKQLQKDTMFDQMIQLTSVERNLHYLRVAKEMPPIMSQQVIVDTRTGN